MFQAIKSTVYEPTARAVLQTEFSAVVTALEGLTPAEEKVYRTTVKSVKAFGLLPLAAPPQRQ